MFKNAHPGKAGGAFLTFCRGEQAGGGHMFESVLC